MLVGDRQRPSVRRQIERQQAVSGPGEHADRGRAADERREQVAARLRCVVERDALAGEQQRAVPVVLQQRLGAEPLGLGGDRLLARLAALVQGDETGDDGDDQQRADADEPEAQPPLRALARGAALASGTRARWR